MTISHTFVTRKHVISETRTQAHNSLSRVHTHAQYTPLMRLGLCSTAVVPGQFQTAWSRREEWARDNRQDLEDPRSGWRDPDFAFMFAHQNGFQQVIVRSFDQATGGVLREEFSLPEQNGGHNGVLDIAFVDGNHWDLVLPTADARASLDLDANFYLRGAYGEVSCRSVVDSHKSASASTSSDDAKEEVHVLDLTEGMLKPTAATAANWFMIAADKSRQKAAQHQADQAAYRASRASSAQERSMDNPEEQPTQRVARQAVERSDALSRIGAAREQFDGGAVAMMSKSGRLRNVAVNALDALSRSRTHPKPSKKKKK